MDINELRIGSYYNYDGESIKLDGSTLSSYLQNDMDLYLEPIKITEEWLLKFGLKENDMFITYIHVKSGLELMNISHKYFRAYYRRVAIKSDIIYVHQLQNLYFALTNEELIKK